MIFKTMIQQVLDTLFKYVKEGQFVKGEKLLKRRKILFFFLIKKSLFKSKYFFLFGVFLINKRNYRKAIVYLKKSLYSYRYDISENLFYLIVAFLNLGNNEQVIYYYKKLLDRTHNPFFIMLAHYYCIKFDKNFKFSTSDIKSILPEDPENIFEILSFVIYYILLNKLSKAYDIMQKYHTTFNNNFFYNLLYIKLLFLLKKYDEVIAFIEKNNNTIESTELLNIFAASLFKLKLWEQSIQVLKVLQKNTKNSNNFKINIAKILINKSQYIKAIKILRPLVKPFAKNKNIRYSNFLLGLVHQKSGLINEAIHYYTKNITEVYKDEKSIFNLSLIYYDFNDFENAKKYLLLIKDSDVDKIKMLYNKWNQKINITANSKKTKTIKRISKIIILFPLFIIIFALLTALIFIVILKYKG